jgi:NAD kinase
MNRSLNIHLTNQKLRALVVADGRSHRELTPNMSLEVRKSENYSVFVRMNSTPSLESLSRLQEMERTGL